MSDPVVETTESLKAELLLQRVIHEDQANQQANRVRALETRLSATEQRLSQCSLELDAAKAENNSLKEQAANSANSATTSKADTLALSNQLHILEASNRDSLGLIQRKVDEIARLEDEFQKNQTTLVEWKQTAARLEVEAQELRSKETSNKFSIEQLLQEVTLHKQQSEWYRNELEAKSEEYSVMRKDRGEKIARLELELDTARTQAREIADKLASSERHVEILEKNRRDDEITVRELRERIASETETFYQEMVAKEKVGHLWEQQAKETGERLKELDAALEATREQGRDKDDRIVQLQSQYEAHLEAFRQERDEAQRTVERLEVQLRRANGLLDSGSISTGENMSAISMISKTAAVASKVQKFGMTFTEVYADYVKNQEQLEERDREVERLNECLTGILAELNERAPEFNEMRAEYARLTAEMESMSAQLEGSIKERETAEEKAKMEKLDRERIEKERNILERGNADLGRQVQYLVREIARHRGCSAGPPPSMEEPEEATTADEVVTGHLLPFRTIQELQSQNQNLLAMVRQLSETAEEAENQQEKMTEYKTSVEEAYTLVTQLRDELRAVRNQKDAHKKEAESLRMALERRSNATPGTPTPARRSGQESEESPHVEASQIGIVPDWPDLREENAALQDAYESLRREIGEDQKTLREEADKYRREASEARKEMARSRNEVESMQRYEALIKQQQESNTRELKEYREREARLQQRIAKFEIAASRSDDERAVAEQQIQQLRHLVTTLQAEKKIGTDSNERLKAEAARLGADNSRLSVLLSQTQSMQNQLEMTEREARRRAEMLAETLKSELQAARERMTEEMENVRSLTARREAELRGHQNKLDKINQDYQKAREELVAHVVSEDHLKQRVSELTEEIHRIQDRGNEGPRSMSPVEIFGSSDTVGDASEDIIRMKGELKQLRADLEASERKRVVLESAAEQYRNISQANEETLRDTTASHEAYAAEATERIEELERELAKTKELCAKLEASEGQAVLQLAELQERNEAERTAWENEKHLLVEQVKELNSVEEQLRSVRASLSEDIRRQAEIARQAQEDYQREILRRASDIQALGEMKDKYAELHRQVDGFKREAENAKIALESAQASWQEQKKALEEQISDMQKRSKDLEDQNDTLHEHLEAVNAQALRIQQSAAEPGSQGTDGSVAVTLDRREEELREVIRYLRREREIVDGQNNVVKLEAQRIKQQSEHLRKELDEARQELMEERSKQQHAVMSEARRVEFTTKLEQLNLLRESNVTLREENRRNEAKLAQLKTRLQDLQVKLDPLEEQVENLQVEVQAKDEEIQKLEESNASWRKRTQQILEKYERIDPIEHQKLKDDSDALRKEIEALSALKEQNETMTNENQILKKEIEEHVAHLQNKEKEVDLLRAKHDTARRAHQAWQNKAKETETMLMARTEELQKMQEESAKSATVEGQQNANAQQLVAELETQLSAANAEKEMIRTELTTRYNNLLAQARKLKEHAASMRKEQEIKLKQAEGVQQTSPLSATTGGSDEALEQVRREAEEQRKTAVEQAIQRTTHEMMLRDQVKASMLETSKAQNFRLQERIRVLEIQLSDSRASDSLAPPGVLSALPMTPTAPPALPTVVVPNKSEAPLKRPREVSLSPVRAGLPTTPSQTETGNNKRPRTADTGTTPELIESAGGPTLLTSGNSDDRSVISAEAPMCEDTATAAATEPVQHTTTLEESGIFKPQQARDTDGTGLDEATETETPSAFDDIAAEEPTTEESVREGVSGVPESDAQILQQEISATREGEAMSGEETFMTEDGSAANTGTDLPKEADIREEATEMDLGDETVRVSERDEEIDTSFRNSSGFSGTQEDKVGVTSRLDAPGDQTLDYDMSEPQMAENELEQPYDEDVEMNTEGAQESAGEYNENDAVLAMSQDRVQESEVEEGQIGDTTMEMPEQKSAVETELASEDLTDFPPLSSALPRRPISPIRFDGPQLVPTPTTPTTTQTPSSQSIVQPTGAIEPPPLSFFPVSTPTSQATGPTSAFPVLTPVSVSAPAPVASSVPVTVQVSPAPVPAGPKLATPTFRPPSTSVMTPSPTDAVRPRVTLSASARPFLATSSSPSTPSNVTATPTVPVTAPARTQQPQPVRPPSSAPFVLPTPPNAAVPTEDPNSESRFKPKPITFDLGPDPISTGAPAVKRKPQAATDGAVSDSETATRKPRIDRDQLPGIVPPVQSAVALSAFSPITTAMGRSHNVPITPSSSTTAMGPGTTGSAIMHASGTAITPSPAGSFGRSSSMSVGRGNQGMRGWGVVPRGRANLYRGGGYRGVPRGGTTGGGGGTGGGTEGGV